MFPGAQHDWVVLPALVLRGQRWDSSVRMGSVGRIAWICTVTEQELWERSSHSLLSLHQKIFLPHIFTLTPHIHIFSSPDLPCSMQDVRSAWCPALVQDTTNQTCIQCMAWKYWGCGAVNEAKAEKQCFLSRSTLNTPVFKLFNPAK